MDEDLIVLWVANGVYFGYRPDDIISFVKRTSKGEFAPPDTLLSGTGYITLEKSMDKDEMIAEINQKRFCPLSFPICPDAEETMEQTAFLFSVDTEYRYQVIEILNKVGVTSYGTNPGNL